MTVNVLKRLATFALVAGIAGTFATTTAHASVSVEYTTAGLFGNGTNSVTLTAASGNTMTISFTGASNHVLVPPASSGEDFGTFHISYSNPAANDQFTLNTTFVFTITQTSPSSGSTTFPSATVTGNIQFLGSQAFVEFPNTGPMAIGEARYSIDQNDVLHPGRVNLSKSGDTDLKGTVTAVPEPSTVAMIVAGLPLAGFVALRRNRRNPA